jgi:hypothetical protein
MTPQFVMTVLLLALVATSLGWVVGLLPFYVPIVVCLGIGAVGVYYVYTIGKEIPELRDLDD